MRALTLARCVFAVSSLTGLGCEEPMAPEPLVLGPPMDAGDADAGERQTDAAGPGDDLEANSRLYGRCVFDPNEVYVLGWVQLNGPSTLAVFRPEAPDDVCFLSTWPADAFIRPTDGALLYREEDRLRTLAADKIVRSAGKSSLPQADANDPTETFPCLDSFGITPEGDIYRSCYDASQKKTTFYTDTPVPEYFTVNLIGANGLKFGSALDFSASHFLIDKTGMSVDIVGTYFVRRALPALRTHGAGFRVVRLAEVDQPKELWFVDADGVATLEATYASDPPGSWEGRAALDGRGTLFVFGTVDEKPAIARITATESSVIYTEADASEWVDLKAMPPKFHPTAGQFITGP